MTMACGCRRQVVTRSLDIRAGLQTIRAVPVALEASRPAVCLSLGVLCQSLDCKDLHFVWEVRLDGSLLPVPGRPWPELPFNCLFFFFF